MNSDIEKIEREFKERHDAKFKEYYDSIEEVYESIREKSGISNTKNKYLHFFSVAVTILFGVVIAFGVLTWISLWVEYDTELKTSTSQCFELQEIAGKTLKVNTCTGEVYVFDLNKDVIK